jgi:hypothetical protein
MWACSNCDVPLPDSYEVCWQCGASRAGVIDANFRVAEEIPKDELVDPPRETISPPPWRWQFRLSSVLTLTTIVAFAFALFSPEDLASMAIAVPLLFGLWLLVMFAIAGLTCALAFAFGTIVDPVRTQSREIVDDNPSTDDTA